MADKTGIEWTEQTWNPTTGCDRISPGCDNCYALTMAKRLKGMGAAKYQTDGNPKTSGPGFGLAMHQDTLTDPLRWKKPRRVFVNSMSDLFHAKVSDEFIAQVFAVMALTPQHTYQILTKRHGRMRSLVGGPDFEKQVDRALLTVPELSNSKLTRRSWPLPKPGWPLPNVHLGVSVEDQKRADLRIPALLDTPAAVRFLSCEPLLGPVRLFETDHSRHSRDWDGGDWICLDCSTDEETVAWRTTERAPLDLGWVIIGGESGPGARPLNPDWVADLIDDSRTAGAAPFVKQLGSIWARENNASDAKGGKPADWPEHLRVREYPDTP
ncbi:phage Gp37/Gp68 family protein (plasmid) [Streptomyces sp. NBC_01369]|uniref:DUF5131 family protein n=1 Tax=Streptomyces sp. NBC_01369 TaxID=2903842 RepID=UPI002F90B62C